MRDRYPFHVRVVALDNGYGLPLGYSFAWGRRSIGDTSPYNVWAVDTDGQLFQFRESEVEVLDAKREV